MKLWNWFIKCPMLFLLLAAWLGLTAFTWSEGRMPDALEKDVIENPVFTALLESETDSLELDIDESDIMLSDTEGSDIQDSGTEGSDTDDMDAEDAGMGKSGAAFDAENAESSGAEGPDEKNSDDKNSDKGNTDTEKTDAENTDKKFSDAAGSDSQKKDKQEADKTGSDAVLAGRVSGSGDAKKADGKSTGDGIKAGVTKFKSYKKIQTDSQYYSDPGKKALTTEFAYDKADKSYFDDAVFIGDSRTVGMQDYSGLENASFFAKTGMNVYEVLEDKFIKDPESGKDVSVAHMLKTNQYGKIYFMVGINELGTGNTGTFQKAYERVLNKFRKWQPDAVIYIQGIIPVSEEKASQDAVFNNVNINDKNVAIAQLANGVDTFYLDVSGKLTDKDGYLKADYTFDNVHMYAQYYQLWTNYLMKHAVVKK